MEGTSRDQPGGTTEEGSTRRRGKEPATGGTQAEEMHTPHEHYPQHRTPPTRAFGGAGPSRFRPTQPTQNQGTSAVAASQEKQRHDQRASTPWRLWSAARKEKKDDYVTQGSLTATMDDSRRHRVSEHMKGKKHDDFGRKAWL